MRTAIDVTRRNTRIAVLSFPGIGQGPAPFDAFEPEDFYNRSISYIAVSWMPSDDYPPEFQRFTVTRIYRYILDLMARTRIDLSPIVTQNYPPSVVSRQDMAYNVADELRFLREFLNVTE